MYVGTWTRFGFTSAVDVRHAVRVARDGDLRRRAPVARGFRAGRLRMHGVGGRRSEHEGKQERAHGAVWMKDSVTARQCSGLPSCGASVRHWRNAGSVRDVGVSRPRQQSVFALHFSTDTMTLVTIIGAGTMGRRLAFDFARTGSPVRLHDATPGVADAAVAWLRTTMTAWESEGRVPAGATDAALANVSVCEALAEAANGADVILENVPERLALKRTLFAQLSTMLPDHTVIVSNTSSLPGSVMADASGRADRFINANFSHLGEAKVEVMPNPATSAGTRHAVVALLRAAGFIPIVLQQEQFGYAGNRVWRAVKKEVLRQLAAGTATAEDLDRSWMLDWDVPIGPCGLMDSIGLDVVRDIEQSYADASGDPADRPPAFLDAMIADGKLGVKSGAGFYAYPDPAFRRAGFLDNPDE